MSSGSAGPVCRGEVAVIAPSTPRGPVHRQEHPSYRNEDRGAVAIPVWSANCSSSGMSKLDEQHRKDIPAKEFAFPKQEKEPIHDAAHVRNAIARFNQVEGVTDAERDEAWTRIKAAAKKFGVEVNEGSWKELSHHGKA